MKWANVFQGAPDEKIDNRLQYKQGWTSLLDRENCSVKQVFRVLQVPGKADGVEDPGLTL